MEYDINCAQFAFEIKPIGISGLRIEKKQHYMLQKLAPIQLQKKIFYNALCHLP